MPQPKNTPKPAEADAALDPGTAVEPPAAPDFIALVLAKDDGDLSTAERQIKRALVLEKTRAEHQDKISKNRDYLRLMDGNEELTEEQGAWLDSFYPVKEKGEQRTKEEIELTRKAKERARNL